MTPVPSGRSGTCKTTGAPHPKSRTPRAIRPLPTRADLRWDIKKGYVTPITGETLHAGWPGPVRETDIQAHVAAIDEDIRAHLKRQVPGMQQVALSVYATSIADRIINAAGVFFSHSLTSESALSFL